MIPGLATGSGSKFEGSSSSSAEQTQSFNVGIGGNQGVNFASSDGWKLGLVIAGLTLAALVGYAGGKKRKG